MKVHRPHCADCGSAHPRVVTNGNAHLWLCADCEWKRNHPGETQTMPAMPWERRPAPLQRESLF